MRLPLGIACVLLLALGLLFLSLGGDVQESAAPSIERVASTNNKPASLGTEDRGDRREATEVYPGRAGEAAGAAEPETASPVTVKLRAVDPSGQPVPYATVCLQDQSSPGQNLESGSTDDTGRFRGELGPDMVVRAFVHSGKVGFAATDWLNTEDSKTIDLGELVLESGAEVYGVVRDPLGRPIRNAMVTVAENRGWLVDDQARPSNAEALSERGCGIGIGHTNVDGAFRIHGLKTGAYFARVNHRSGFRVAPYAVHTPPPDEGGLIELSTGNHSEVVVRGHRVLVHIAMTPEVEAFVRDAEHGLMAVCLLTRRNEGGEEPSATETEHEIYTSIPSTAELPLPGPGRYRISAQWMSFHDGGENIRGMDAVEFDLDGSQFLAEAVLPIGAETETNLGSLCISVSTDAVEYQRLVHCLVDRNDYSTPVGQVRTEVNRGEACFELRAGTYRVLIEPYGYFSTYEPGQLAPSMKEGVRVEAGRTTRIEMSVVPAGAFGVTLRGKGAKPKGRPQFRLIDASTGARVVVDVDDPMYREAEGVQLNWTRQYRSDKIPVGLYELSITYGKENWQRTVRIDPDKRTELDIDVDRE